MLQKIDRGTCKLLAKAAVDVPSMSVRVSEARVDAVESKNLKPIKTR